MPNSNRFYVMNCCIYYGEVEVPVLIETNVDLEEIKKDFKTYYHFVQDHLANHFNFTPYGNSKIHSVNDIDRNDGETDNEYIDRLLTEADIVEGSQFVFDINKDNGQTGLKSISAVSEEEAKLLAKFMVYEQIIL